MWGNPELSSMLKLVIEPHDFVGHAFLVQLHDDFLNMFECHFQCLGIFQIEGKGLGEWQQHL